jgi:prenyltransferase beta subunit
VTPARLLAAYAAARDALLAERNADGFWVGELSSSALSTATAVIALHLADSSEFSVLIRGGLNWLQTTQNPDGGWGDTTKSFSNISTSMLARAAFAITGEPGDVSPPGERPAPDCSPGGLTSPGSLESRSRQEAVLRLEKYLTAKCGTTPAARAEAIRARYGKDRTFSVPILMTCALAGLVPWHEVPRLPFELACLPQSWYRFAGLPVVSYALPALIAIGQCVHAHRPTWNPVTGPLRWLSRNQSLKVLRRIQPSSGGYLEATPLTSFVVMGLLGTFRRHSPADDDSHPLPLGKGRFGGAEPGEGGGAAKEPERNESPGSFTAPPPSPGLSATLSPRGEGPAFSPTTSRSTTDRVSVLPADAARVIADSVRFLTASARPDGSWPIDTNLSIWVTTLAVNALAAADDLAFLPDKEKTLAWLLAQQTKERHPYTGAAPGGWGWSHCPGSVPDCDDTPGAVLAVEVLGGSKSVIEAGRKWMLGLQNGDGGFPTFCHGWGKLPFDRSGNDLTAHVFRAFASRAKEKKLTAWQQIRRYISEDELWDFMSLRFLLKSQIPDGSWLPLWFGNQHAPDDENPVYGTARVLASYRDLGFTDSPECQRGVNYLFSVQNPDGGWGGAKGCPSSVEETALAVEVLIDLTSWRAGSVSDRSVGQHDNQFVTASGNAPVVDAPGSPKDTSDTPVARGLAWLTDAVESGRFRDPSPIGFYFAKLWYFEKLYPLVFTVAALGRATRVFRQSDRTA